MKIIILGAGQVGSTLAANLVSEDNDITLIDDESMRLEHLQDKHDLRVMQGLASSPKVLREAGAPDADLRSPVPMKLTWWLAKLLIRYLIRPLKSRVFVTANI